MSVLRTNGPLVLMKFSIFTAEKKICILHGQVFVMIIAKPGGLLTGTGLCP